MKTLRQGPPWEKIVPQRTVSIGQTAGPSSEPPRGSPSQLPPSSKELFEEVRLLLDGAEIVSTGIIGFSTDKFIEGITSVPKRKGDGTYIVMSQGKMWKLILGELSKRDTPSIDESRVVVLRSVGVTFHLYPVTG